MRRVGLVLVIFSLCLTACGSSSDESEAIHGTWSLDSPPRAYEAFQPDGTWSAYYEGEPPVDWGTYTLEDGVLTMSTADDGWCGPDGASVWEVAFSEGGDKVQETLVSVSCANEAHFGRERVLTRHTP